MKDMAWWAVITGWPLTKIRKNFPHLDCWIFLWLTGAAPCFTLFNQLLESSQHSPLAYAITFSDLCLFVVHLEGLPISLSLQLTQWEISWEPLEICLRFHGGKKVGYQCNKCISCTFSFALLYNTEKIHSPWEVIIQRNRMDVLSFIFSI